MSTAEYTLDDGTVIQIEYDRGPGFRPAGADEVVGKIRDAVRPAVEAARIVLDSARDTGPDEIEVKFGIKVSGTMNWWIARAATDANFEITMTWKSGDGRAVPTN